MLKHSFFCLKRSNLPSVSTLVLSKDMIFWIVNAPISQTE